MAMRMPRLFRPADSAQTLNHEWQLPGPRSISAPAPLLRWPKTDHADACREVQTLARSKAQIRTKRFPGHTGGEEDRFSTVIESAGTSPSALLTALARAMETSPELSQEPRDGSPFILEVRVVAG